MEAAVSLIIRASAELDVLLIKRAESEQDPWSGHIAPVSYTHLTLPTICSV